MPTPDEHKLHGSHGPTREQIDTSVGYEQTDVQVTGIVVFLFSLVFLVGACGAIVWGIGKVINAHLNAEDGPTSKWSKTADVRDLGNLPASPALQHKVAVLTEDFPTPRVQTDDGNQDVADLHQREDLLLENYSWADAGHTKVRIPIERAMELIAQRGLPVAPPSAAGAMMTGDAEPVITVPLTNGFARTGYEQDQAAAREAQAAQKQ